jgi:iron complex outermembrane recepter protein
MKKVKHSVTGWLCKLIITERPNGSLYLKSCKRQSILMRTFGILVLFITIVGIFPAYAANEEAAAYNLKLEDLLDSSVSTVSKKARTQVSLASKKSQSLTTTAAATYVINNDDIKRSGATNLPDVLRLAPGLDVTRIDSNKWSVSARGFSGRFANKLLVLIDGRTVYNPTFFGRLLGKSRCAIR